MAGEGKQLEDLLKTLNSWLHSEMNVQSGGAKVTVEVRNDAPLRDDGGDVVFIGVGLRISDTRDRSLNTPRWACNIQMNRPSDKPDLRKRYSLGAWIPSGRGGGGFPDATSDEQSFGEILFPGESVTFAMEIPPSEVPYTDIRVEGSVSRRHLFHFVQGLRGFEPMTKPLLVETFRALRAVDIQSITLSATGTMPNFGPKTTLEEISAFRQTISKSIEQINQTMQSLNEVYRSAPHYEIKEHLKQVIGKYLQSLKQACEKTSAALSSGNTEHMREAADSLRQHLAACKEVYRETMRLMERFGIDPMEMDLKSELG